MKKIVYNPLFGFGIAFVIYSVFLLILCVFLSLRGRKEFWNSPEIICPDATKQAAEASAFGEPVVITETYKIDKNKIRFIYHFVRGNRQNLIAVCKVNNGKPEIDLVSYKAMLGG